MYAFMYVCNAVVPNMISLRILELQNYSSYDQHERFFSRDKAFYVGRVKTACACFLQRNITN